MRNEEIGRRTFLRRVGTGVAGVYLGMSGCGKSSRRRVLSDKIVFSDEERYKDVSELVDNSLGGGFSYDFTELERKGVRFGEFKELNGERYSFDAQGFSFIAENGVGEKLISLTSLREREGEISLDFMSGDRYVDFEGIRGIREIEIEGKNYVLDLQTIGIADSFEGEIIPFPLMTVNGVDADFNGGYAFTEGLNFMMDLRRFYADDKIAFLVSPEYFRSKKVDPLNPEFSGLERIVEKNRNGKLGNRYNGGVQEDAYFRVEANVDGDNVYLKRADKIRVDDEELFRIIDLPSRRPTKREIEIRVEESERERGGDESFGKSGLSGDFSFVFDPVLEARLRKDQIVSGMVELPELASRKFEVGGREYFIRYVAFDGRKAPNASQPFGQGDLFLSNCGILTEILENPVEVKLEQGLRKEFDFGGDRYQILLNNVILGAGAGIDPFYELIVSKNGESEETVVRTLSHGYSNRALGINIDPNLSNDGSFYISKNKFSSAVDFGDDLRLSGLRKSVEFVSGGNGNFVRQFTLANKLNGEIQDSGFRANVEFGIKRYDGSNTNFENESYKIIPDEGFDFSDMIGNGYILRVKSFEKGNY